MSSSASVVFALWSAFACCRSATADDRETGYGSAALRAFQPFQDCPESQLGPCVRRRLLAALDRIDRQPELELFDGVLLVRDPASRAAADAARSADDGPDRSVVDRLVEFIRSRSVRFRLFDDVSARTADGRKKSNKYNTLMMYPFMMGGMTVPLAFGVLALLAGKALIIAKLALALSAIVGLKKLFGDNGAGHEYVAHAGGSGHYRRSLPGEPVAAADMAYGSYSPVHEEPIRSTTTVNAIPL